jgi:restriction system protein
VTKRKKNAILSLVYSLLFFYFIYYIFENRLYEVKYLFAAIITPIVITKIVDMLIPIRKNNKTTQMLVKSNVPNKINSDSDLLSVDIDTLSGSDFERLVYLYFKDKGFNPKLIGGSGDHGVDLVLTDPRNGVRIAVQCKRWKKTNNVGNGDIIKLNGGKEFYNCSNAICITSSNYTSKAKEFAEKCNILIWNRLHVYDKIDKWRKEKLKMIS